MHGSQPHQQTSGNKKKPQISEKKISKATSKITRKYFQHLPEKFNKGAYCSLSLTLFTRGINCRPAFEEPELLSEGGKTGPHLHN